MVERSTEENGAIIGGQHETSGNAVVVDGPVDGTEFQSDGITGEDFKNPAAIFGEEGTANGNASGSSAGTASADNPEISFRTGKPKRAYRKRGEGNGAQTVSNSLSDFGGLIFAIHEMAAAFAHCPEIELDENEARKIAKASRELMGFYQVELSPEKVVWMNFAGAMIGVYGPRVVAVAARKKNEKAARKPPPSQPPNTSSVATDAAFPPRKTATIFDFTKNGVDE